MALAALILIDDDGPSENAVVLGGLGWVVAIISIILSIMAFMKTKDGIPYRYPFALRLIK